MTADQMDKFSKATTDTAVNLFGACTRNAQAIASELADYSKKSIQDSAAAWENLMAAKSLEKALEVQSDYLKSSYEDFIARSAKLGDLYLDLIKEAYRPFEGALGEAAVMA